MAYQIPRVLGDNRPRINLFFLSPGYGNYKYNWVNVSTLWNGAVNVNEERLSGWK